MTKQETKNQRTIQVQYTIIDGEHEYADHFFMKANGVNDEEQAYKELAEFYACDKEEEQEIVSDLRKEGMAMIGCRAIKRITIHELETIIVYVCGGVIQDIQNIPEGIQIRVQDYDIDNLTDKELHEETEPDEEGNPCVVGIWENQ